MPVIGTGQDVCTVVVTVDAEADVLPDLIAHAAGGLERFGDCEGFVGGALHVSDDGTRLVQYVQWSSEEAYIACRDDPRWDGLASTELFMAHLAAGRALIDARVYRVVASVDEG